MKVHASVVEIDEIDGFASVWDKSGAKIARKMSSPC